MVNYERLRMMKLLFALGICVLLICSCVMMAVLLPKLSFGGGAKLVECYTATELSAERFLLIEGYVRNVYYLNENFTDCCCSSKNVCLCKEMKK